MRLVQSVAPVLCVVTLLAGCKSLGFGGRSMEARLAPQNDSGESGTASLTKQGDTQTKVVLSVAGAPAGVSQPVHIHKGTCAKLDPNPAMRPSTSSARAVTPSTVTNLRSRYRRTSSAVTSERSDGALVVVT
jgi:hypothetical protein